MLGGVLCRGHVAVRAGDTLVVPKLDPLARSVPDARVIAARLSRAGSAKEFMTFCHFYHELGAGFVVAVGPHLPKLPSRLASVSV